MKCESLDWAEGKEERQKKEDRGMQRTWSCPDLDGETSCLISLLDQVVNVMRNWVKNLVVHLVLNLVNT
eukprot:13556-Ditylum_brightwellii.AAC.1